MLTNTHLSLANTFHPIGDTPAVNLLRDRISVDSGANVVKILSLGCGDARNLLFSLWCEDGCSDGSLFYFTFCDVEPAILARNIILFTLLIDQSSSDITPEKSNTYWSIFYHFFIPTSHLEIIQEQAAKLLSLTETSEKWKGSPYNELLQFLSLDTLSQIRRIWSRYLATKTQSRKKTKKTDKFVRESIKAIQEFYGDEKRRIHGSLAAGCHGARADDIMAESYRSFWETGVAGGNAHDVNALDNNGKGFINPMLSVSSAPTGAFAVYSESDPLLGFHLAPAFDEETATVETVVRFAKAQFHDWNLSFLNEFKADRFRIRLFCGDAIAFCYELYVRRQDVKATSCRTRQHPRQWTVKRIELYFGEIPRTFDIIDTSSLINNVGILNLLPLAAALLSHTTSSVLYTEIMVRPKLDLKDYFSTILCGDLTVFSLILGISPLAYLLGYTVDITGNDLSTRKLGDTESRTPQRQWVRIPWRCPMQGDAEALNSYLASPVNTKVSFDHKELAEFFFKVYLNMFAFEDETKWNDMTYSTKEVTTDHVTYYSRPCFAALVQLALRNIVVDRDQFIDNLVFKIRHDETLVHNRHNLQDLFCHMRLARLDGIVGAPTSRQQANVTGDESSRDRVLTLVVPRDRLNASTKGSPHDIGDPGLHIGIFMDPPAEGPFYVYCYAIQCFFGSIRLNHVGETMEVLVDEDDEEWEGTKDLLVTCTFSSCILKWGLREDMRVCLAVTPHPMAELYPENLGRRMVVFESELTDKRYVKIWNARPHESPVTTTPTQEDASEPTQIEGRTEKGIAHVKLDDNTLVKSMELILAFPEMSVADRALAKISVTQGSPCTLLMHMTGFPPRRLVFPFPVDCSSSGVEAQRRTALIKVRVATAPYTTQSGSQYNACPVVVEKGDTAAWGFHRVQISRLPRISSFVRADLYDGWLKRFARQSTPLNDNGPEHSELETGIYDGGDIIEICVDNDDMVFIEFIRVIFWDVMGKDRITPGWPEEPLNVYPIARKDGVYSIIFTSSLRHDLEGGSVILEAYIVHLSTNRRDVRIDQQLVDELGASTFCLYDRVAKMWDDLLPALAERCRDGIWQHGDSCEYGQHGDNSQLAAGKSPLCSCGEGKGLESFPADSRYRGLAKYATRIALSPIFTIPYVESVADYPSS